MGLKKSNKLLYVTLTLFSSLIKATYMKKSGFILLMITITLSSFSQVKTPIVKGSAYLRESTPGIIPKVIGEDGKESTKTVTKIKSYQLFIEYKKNTTIKATKLWIDGIAYHVRTETITSTPVLFKTNIVANSYTTDTLVTKTSNKVIQLLTDGEIKPIPKSKPKNATGKIIVEYSYKGKTYLYTFKEITKITPQILQ